MAEDTRSAAHLTFEHYLRTESGAQHPSVAARLVLDHLDCSCADCRRIWSLVAGEREKVLGRVDAVREAPWVSPSPSPEPEPNATPAVRRRLERDVADLRAERRRWMRQLWILLALPRERRRDHVESAHRRFSSRGVAEVLLAASRERVRHEPEEAENLASLVPVVLRRLPRPDRAWAIALGVRAAAHRANALRIAGDLAGAEKVFLELDHRLAAGPSVDLATRAEIASLAASLRFDQRHFEEADELLDFAIVLFSHLGDVCGEARSLIKQGMIHQAAGRPEQALDRFSAAAERLNDGDQSYLLLSTVNGKVLCLCDLEQWAEADELLIGSLDLYEASDDIHAGATLRALQGRVALGLGRFDEAATAYEDCRDGHLTLGRSYDAVLATLDLACVPVEAGRTTDLRRLAAEIIPTFRACGVARETLASLRLLTKAVVAESVTRDLLERLRVSVERSRPPSAPTQTRERILGTD